MRYSKQLDDMLRKNYEEQLEMAKKYDELMKKKKEQKSEKAFINKINSEITDATDSLNSHIRNIENKINALDTRVSILETAADRCGISKRPRRKLTIKVSA